MQHLSDEDLARLADEAPTAEEEAHLALCAECRGEVEMARAQLQRLRALGDLEPPANEWPLLARRLRAEGLMGSAEDAAPRWRAAAPRIAAALVLFLAGGLSGALLRGGIPATSPGVAPLATATTPAEAEAALVASESAYVAALERYAELTTGDETDDPINRLAALEGIVLTTRAALKESPGDPVINGYHLTALTQREAILRRMSGEARGGSDDGWY